MTVDPRKARHGWIQKATKPCGQCGGTAIVEATDSPYAFTWRCACGNAGSISWTDRQPPPVFEKGAT